MLWIYTSQELDALDMKVAEFEEKFRNEKVLHLRRVDFERLQLKLTQVGLFEEFTHFIFEDYIGSFKEIESLFKTINITSSVLITKLSDSKSFLSGKLIKLLEDKNYFLYKTTVREREKYLTILLKRYDLKLSDNLLNLIKTEGISTSIQIKGIVDQLKTLMQDKSFELSEEILRELISSNNVLDYLEEKGKFLKWYLTGQIKEWYLFLKKIEKSNIFLTAFFRSFCSSLNYHFGNNRLDSLTLRFIRALSYNFFIFIEEEIFKIKKDSSSLLTYFFGKNRPLAPLVWS